MTLRNRFGSRHRSPALAKGLITAALLALSAGQAMASEPKDRIICTEEPQTTWMSEAQARERFQASAYMLLTFKVSSENCHEFYAIEHDGTVVEAYVHPVTGEIVRFTRIPPPGKALAPDPLGRMPVAPPGKKH